MSSSESIFKSVQEGDYGVIERFLDTRHSANTVDADGCTLLHWAALNNRVQLTKLLINAGADVNLGGGAGKQSPLEWALAAKHYFIAELLYKNGADLQYKSSTTGLDVLHTTIRNVCIDSNAVFLLLFWGANSNSVDTDGNTPLMWLLKNRARDGATLSDQYVDVIRMLIKFDSNPATFSGSRSDGNGPLHLLGKLSVVCRRSSGILRFSQIFSDFLRFSDSQN